MLYCSGCKQTKPKKAFAKNRSRARGYQSHCKVCFRERWNRFDPVRYRKRYLKHRYGLSWERYLLMWELQGHRCAICPRELLLVSQNKLLTAHPDHDHNTNIVRALLCHNCNSALGYFQEHPGLLMKAARYLMYFKAHPDQAGSETTEKIIGGWAEQELGYEVDKPDTPGATDPEILANPELKPGNGGDDR